MSRFRRRSGRKQYSSFVMLFLILLAFPVAVILWKGFAWAVDFTGRNSKYDAIILDAARRNQVDPRLIKAVIWRESRFNSGSVGKAGEIGLMQIMQENAVADWAKANRKKIPSKGALFNPALNIEIGSWYLSRAIKRWGRYRDCYVLALCEYNAGLSRANRWKPADPNGDVRSKIAISSTLSYVDSILNQYEKYKESWNLK